LRALPLLDVFDRHHVTDIDRKQAEKFGQPRTKRANSSTLSKSEDELSGTMKMMMKEVNAYKKAEAKRAQAEIEAQFSALASSPFASTGIPPPAYTFLKSATNEKSLDEWEKYHLKKAFEQYDKDKSGYLSRQELRQALDDVKDSGKKIVWEEYTCLGISEASSDDQKLDALFDVLDADNNNKITWNEFYTACTRGIEDSKGRAFPPLQWSTVGADAALSRSKELYAQAQELREQAMLMDSSDPKQKEYFMKSNTLSTRANKLQAIHTDVTSSRKPPPKPKPGARSDTVNFFSFQSRDVDEDESDDDESCFSEQRKKLGLTGSEFSNFKNTAKQRKPRRLERGTLSLSGSMVLQS